MKVINKILCFLSVLVLCVPLLCFNVSAADTSELTLEEFYLTGGTGDWSSMSVDSISGSSFSTSFPNFGIANNSGDLVTYDCSDVFARFKLGYACMYKTAIETEFKDYYYIIRYGSLDYDSYERYCVSTFYSESPISLSSDNSLVSSSSIYESHLNIANINGYCQNGFPATCWGNVGFVTYSSPCTLFNDKLPFNQNLNFNVTEIYSNCITEYNGNKVSERPKSSALKDNIDVKLTPNFGLDMDRVDPLTNQSDYFKFEITNNSDSAIQWCAGIYDPELVTADTMDILNLSSWAYVSRTTYYDFSVKEDKGIFRTTYTYSGALKTGSFDYHYLEPGETFSDLIFWENIKINPNVIYHFFVNAVKSDLNYASLNIDPPVTEESSDMHSVTVIEDTYYNTILEGASSFRKLDCNIYNIEFSCLSMPAFTTTVRGGNSVLNTSGNDRYQLYNNYETVSDINGLDTKINKNYTDPAILANTFNRSDVSVDIDSFSVDDVKSYITSCQSFFILIKEALLSFPSFIWALICFGLTGLIVIAVVKALL